MFCTITWMKTATSITTPIGKFRPRGNRRKLDLVWAKEENIQFLSTYIKTLINVPTFGICHGTRRGKEQEWFAKYIGCKVIGTEISDTADQFPNTIQWDFHKTKPEWLQAVDFIYSNSFDHSFNPEECLTAWMSCLKKGGVCILEHTTGHGISGASDLDPFGVDLAVFPYLILKWGKGKYAAREILNAPIPGPAGSPKPILSAFKITDPVQILFAQHLTALRQHFFRLDVRHQLRAGFLSRLQNGSHQLVPDAPWPPDRRHR